MIGSALQSARKDPNHKTRHTESSSDDGFQSEDDLETLSNLESLQTFPANEEQQARVGNAVANRQGAFPVSEPQRSKTAASSSPRSKDLSPTEQRDSNTFLRQSKLKPFGRSVAEASVTDAPSKNSSRESVAGQSTSLSKGRELNESFEEGTNLSEGKENDETRSPVTVSSKPSSPKAKTATSERASDRGQNELADSQVSKRVESESSRSAAPNAEGPSGSINAAASGRASGSVSLPAVNLPAPEPSGEDEDSAADEVEQRMRDAAGAYAGGEPLEQAEINDASDSDQAVSLPSIDSETTGSPFDLENKSSDGENSETTDSSPPLPASPTFEIAESDAEDSSESESLTTAEKSVALQSLAESGQPEPSLAGGSPGTAISAEQKPASTPDLAGKSPEHAMSELRTLSPREMQKSLPGLDAAVDTDVNRGIDEIAANPPKVKRPSGSPKVNPTKIASERKAASKRIEKTASGPETPTPKPSPLPKPPPSPGRKPQRAIRRRRWRRQGNRSRCAASVRCGSCDSCFRSGAEVQCGTTSDSELGGQRGSPTGSGTKTETRRGNSVTSNSRARKSAAGLRRA